LRRRRTFALIHALSFAAAAVVGHSVDAHSGSLDAAGCHAGSQPYHCHHPQAANVGDEEKMASATLLICASLMAVDGDTVECDGQRLRPMGNGAPYVSGFDTPEIGVRADCPGENWLGAMALARMIELLETPGLVVEGSGVPDAFERQLVVLRLPDGSTVGQALIDEGHAREWTPAYKANWCDNVVAAKAGS